MTEKKKKKSNIYLNNKDLLSETIISLDNNKMSDKLAQMLYQLVTKYSKKGNFVNYTYNEDMQGYALMMLVHSWKSFNPEKSSNAFGFFTQCVKNSFIQFLNQEKRQRNIRDQLLIDNGLTPSHTYLEMQQNLTQVNIDDDEEEIDDDEIDTLTTYTNIDNIYIADYYTND